MSSEPAPGSETSRFLTTLFDEMPGCIDLRLIEPDGECERIPCASIDDTLKGVAAARAQTVNVYVGIATRRTMSREKDAGGKRNLAVSRALWVDCDFKHAGDRERFEELLRTFPLPASMIVFSGCGMHVYWLLEEPYDLTTEAGISRFEHTLKGLCDHFGADRSTTDASRILRIPGTANYPDAKKRANGRVPTPCETLAYPGHLFAFSDFEEFEMRGEALAGNGERVTYDATPFDGVLPARVELLLRDARISGRFERDATGLSDQTPSSIDFSLASMLAHRGLSGTEIEAAVRYSRAKDATARPKHDGYFTLTVEKALASSHLDHVEDEHAGTPVDEYVVHEERGAGEYIDLNGAFGAAHVAESFDERPHRTDLGNAKRLVLQHGADIRYCEKLKAWFVFDGRRWAQDESGEVERRAKGTVLSLYAEAWCETAEEQRKAAASWAAKSESRDRIAAMVKLAQSEPEVVVAAEDFDADPMLLNVSNGTVDLRTGELRPYDRRDLLSKKSPVAFDPESRSDLFETTLSRAVPDPAVRGFLQRAAGYTATGLTGEDVLLLLIGPPRAMKGTVLDAIHAALGEYAVTCGLDDLAEREHAGNATPHLMRLRGARMAAIYETGRALKLDAAVVKSLAGSDPITARALYAAPVTFRPCAKFWIATNHRPRVDHDDEGIFERLREVPFLTEIPREERDPSVRARLRDPADAGPAVLAWIVAGAMAWQRDRLGLPPAVEAAGEAYREEMDPLAGFLASSAELLDDDEAWTKSAELRAAYESWCRESGAKPVGEKLYAASLRRHGCKPSRRNPGHGWRGILLTSSTEGMSA